MTTIKSLQPKESALNNETPKLTVRTGMRAGAQGNTCFNKCEDNCLNGKIDSYVKPSDCLPMCQDLFL